MINYGGSITSAFPNTFCSSPSSIACNLCNSNLNDNDTFNNQKSFQKCIHCGVNICEKCLLENQESPRGYCDESNQSGCYSKFKPPITNRSISHYGVVKKEFKHMYNYSKAIVEKLHLLNNTIKIEESTVSELNMIKHQVNTKALELIKQINQEKAELIDQIESVKQKYESTLNERKEYFALSMQYKDELRKVIRKYKEYKSEEKCSLNDLLNLYFSVKNISKNLDDYDHIKLIAEQDPLQVKFEERPKYRNLIGKLVLNRPTSDFSTDDSDHKIYEPCVNSKTYNVYEKKSDSALKKSPIQFFNHLCNSNEADLNKDLSKSFSLNDLINAANELISSKEKEYKSRTELSSAFTNLEKIKNINKSTPVINDQKRSHSRDISTDDEILSRKNNQVNCSPVKKEIFQEKSKRSIPPPPPPAPPIPQNLISNLNKNSLISKSIHELSQKENNQLKNLSKSSIDLNDIKIQTNSNSLKNSQELILKSNPKQRLEVDILPSHLSCSRNKLLISSSYGKIRILDLFSYKMQKDELKSLVINGICMPRFTSPDDESELLYAVTNAQLNSNEDALNVSNSVIIVSKRELKVLKIENGDPGDDYVFSNPSGICFDLNENLYVCDSGYNRVKVFDKSLSVIKIIESASNSQDRLSQPKSVAVHENVLYICDSANHRIVTYQIIDNGVDFKFRKIYGYGYGDETGMLKYPLECCADSKGLLYVRDHHNNRVQVFDTEGNPLQFIEVNSPKETIYSMSVNDNGDIYVAKMVNIQDQDKSGKLNTINKYYIDIY